jgi:hypothetical protein
MGQEIVVGVSTRYEPDHPEIEFRWGRADLFATGEVARVRR